MDNVDNLVTSEQSGSYETKRALSSSNPISALLLVMENNPKLNMDIIYNTGERKIICPPPFSLKET